MTSGRGAIRSNGAKTEEFFLPRGEIWMLQAAYFLSSLNQWGVKNLILREIMTAS